MRDKVLVTIQAVVEQAQVLPWVLSGCNPIKKEFLGLGEERRAGPGMLQSCLSHTMAMSPLAIKSQHWVSTGFGTRTGGDRSPRLGEAQEAPDSVRQTAQGEAKVGSKQRNKTKALTGPWCAEYTQSTTGNTLVPFPSRDRGESNHTSRELPFLTAPGTSELPLTTPLPLPPPLVPRTLISHPMVRMRRCQRRKDSPLHTVDAHPIAGRAGFYLLPLPGTASPIQI